MSLTLFISKHVPLQLAVSKSNQLDSPWLLSLLKPRFQAPLELTDIRSSCCVASPVTGDSSSAQLHHRRKQVHVAGGFVYLSATRDAPRPTENSRNPDPSFPICGLPCCSEDTGMKATFQRGGSQSCTTLLTKGTTLLLWIGYLQA